MEHSVKSNLILNLFSILDNIKGSGAEMQIIREAAMKLSDDVFKKNGIAIENKNLAQLFKELPETVTYDIKGIAVDLLEKKLNDLIDKSRELTIQELETLSSALGALGCRMNTSIEEAEETVKKELASSAKSTSSVDVANIANVSA